MIQLKLAPVGVGQVVCLKGENGWSVIHDKRGEITIVKPWETLCVYNAYTDVQLAGAARVCK